MKLIIKIQDQKIIHELEKLQIEINGRQNLLSYMINNNLNHGENFEFYQQEYFQIFDTYTRKKQELQKQFIDPVLIEKSIKPEQASWLLDFNTEEVTLTYEI